MTNKRYVKTDYKDTTYITAGKVYEIHPNLSAWFGKPAVGIISDSGHQIHIHTKETGVPCAHLEYKGHWVDCDEKGKVL